jgi:hypothetical protein
MTMARAGRYVVCVDNRGNPAALEIRKIYRLLDDPAARTRGLLRVIDESGDDYLYPERFFVRIVVPSGAIRAFGNKPRSGPRRRQARASVRTR